MISPSKLTDDVPKFVSELEKDFGWSAVNFSIVLRNSRNIAKLGQHLADDPTEGSSGLAVLGPKPVLILAYTESDGTTDDMYTVALGKISPHSDLDF